MFLKEESDLLQVDLYIKKVDAICISCLDLAKRYTIVGLVMKIDIPARRTKDIC